MDEIGGNDYTHDGSAASSSYNDPGLFLDLPQQNERQRVLASSSGPLLNLPNETQLPSQQQWNDIRHVLQRMYIDEGRSLENVIQLLRYQQGLKVTKKQLTRRIKMWGMRKNAKLNERVAIVHNYNDTMQNMTSDSSGLKVSRAKLERWQKEMKNVKLSQDAARKSEEEIMTLYPDAPTLHAGGPYRDAESVFEDTGERGANPDPATAVEDEREFNDAHEATSRDNRPLPSAFVEVIGSPKLSRLFAALKVECSEEEIPTFWLDQTFKSASGQVESPCISKDELERLSHRLESGGDPQDGPQELQNPTVSRSIIRNSSTSKSKANPLKYPHLDFLLSQRDDEIQLSPSPFNELYVFPTQYSQQYDCNPATKSLTASELNDLLSWDEKNHRDPLCHEQDQDIIFAMEEQAYSCFEEKNFSGAEYWFRRVLSARKGTEGGNTAKILATALNIIMAIQKSGGIMAARNWHKEIHRTISSHFSPTHWLVLESLRVREVNLWLSEESNEEESLSREILQAILVSFGPKHKKTVGQLEYLATAIMGQGRFAEAEKLFMITLQLCRNVPQVSFDIVDTTIGNLAEVLFRKGQTEPALQWTICRAERADKCLGEDDPRAIGTRRHLAECLRAVGRIEESENIFHVTIRSLVRVLGERHQDTLRCMFYYGHTLCSEGRHSEAAIWLTKSLEGSLESFGPEDRITLHSCYWLVLCLETQGKFDEALQLCERYLQELEPREGITDQHKHIIKVRAWMDEISKHIEMEQRVLDTFAAEEL